MCIYIYIYNLSLSLSIYIYIYIVHAFKLFGEKKPGPRPGIPMIESICHETVHLSSLTCCQAQRCQHFARHILDNRCFIAFRVSFKV